MNRKLLFFLLFPCFILASCSKEPYEDTIRNYYRSGAKIGIYVQSIKIDTAVSGEQAKPFFEKRFDRVKDRLTMRYSEVFNQTKSEVAKQRLDSATRGLFSDKEYEIAYYNDLLSGKFRYEQITVNYKLWVQGETISQTFVARISDTDTTLQITDKDLTHYLTH
jgi:hypothetical protein